MGDPAIERRKAAHLDLCERADVEHQEKSTLLEEVELVHDALAELSLDGVDTSVEFLGKRLRAPLVITGMTGGTAEAAVVNRDLAAVAERTGIAFGLGSQRAMVVEPRLVATYQVRPVAPTALVLGNLGVVQAGEMKTADVERVVAAVGANALCIHLNPAQELVQPEGDRSFRHVSETIARLVRELSVEVIVKETGCGLSARTAARLRGLGVRSVDVSGAGGTSWVRVEQLRGDARSRELGELFRDWGIPTAAALLQLRGAGLSTIASGGVRSGLDVAKAIALGADLCGFALPVFRAYRSGGSAGGERAVAETIEALRVAMVLTGSPDLRSLRRQPVVLGERLARWASPRGFEGRERLP